MTEFYNAIEEPVRELVRQLRDNGINTVCSCGHEMYVQADIIIDGQLYLMHRTIYNYLVDTGQQFPNYTIDIHLGVDRGIVAQSFAHIKILEVNAP